MKHAKFLILNLLTISFMSMFLNSCDSFYNFFYPVASIEIINESGLSITKLCVSTMPATSWGQNLIASPISTGRSKTIGNIPKEVVEIKLAFDSGAIVIQQIDFNATELYKLKIGPPS